MSLIHPLHRLVVDPGHLTAVRLGMPHLTPGGLSETWLLKQLGDVHWQLLAQRIGRPAGAIEDREGRRVYAAFRQVRLEGARLHRAREDDGLSIRSRLWRLSRTQLLSRHELDLDGAAAGSVTLVSAFIRRDGHSNRRVSRVEVPGLCEMPAWDGPAPRGEEPLPPEAGDACDFSFTPCPSEDFNGAGFLYFSSYVAIAERAAFACAPEPAARWATVARSVTYHGNMDVGDSLRVTTARVPCGAGQRRIRSLLRRASDDALLAQVTTDRQPVAP